MYREAALDLLKRGWPLGEESKYDSNHALVLCRMHGFSPGLRFLYEHMRLFREVLQVWWHAACNLAVVLQHMMSKWYWSTALHGSGHMCCSRKICEQV